MIRARALGHVLAALLGLAGALTLAGCGGSGTHATAYASASGGGLTMTSGWVSAVDGAMAGMAVSSMPSIADSESAAYATLHNAGSKPDALVSVTTTAARSATLHATDTSADGSAGTMVAVHAIAVPAGGSVALRPGGFHVMLMRLRASFAPGSSITMTWHFRSGASVTASFPVIDPADRPGER